MSTLRVRGGRLARLVGRIGFVVALVLFVGGCGGGGGAPDTVRIGTFASAVDYAPFYIARKQRLFESAVGAGTKSTTWNSTRRQPSQKRWRQTGSTWSSWPSRRL